MLSTLQNRFAHPAVTFSQRDRLVMIEVANAHGTVRLTTHGATLLSYVPRDGKEIFWVSETAVYDGSKPVRGGVPVCWPWFGPHPVEPAKGAHGFARHQVWEVESVQSLADGATQVVLSLSPNEAIAAVWPYAFQLRLAVTLGASLQVDLIGHNLSDQDLIISEALHTYFRVAQAPGLTIRGLEHTRYFDKNQGFAEFDQTGTLCLAPPMDRVYVDHTAPVVIDDGGNGRQIEVRKQNSASTIVWNPGEEGVKAFADMPDDQYLYMVCVEAGNALQNSYTLRAGEQHTLTMTITSS